MTPVLIIKGEPCPLKQSAWILAKIPLGFASSHWKTYRQLLVAEPGQVDMTQLGSKPRNV
jgi:hypothetical protein